MKMKKSLALLLSLILAAGLTACGSDGGSGSSGSKGERPETKEINGITYTLNPDLTFDNIELSYFHFDQDDTVKYLAERFMELYPNIKVNTRYENVSSYSDVLLAMIANGQSPDIIMQTDCDFALSNMLALDIKEYWDADPETYNLADTVRVAGLGAFQTDGQYAVPIKFFPPGIFIDLNVLEALNVQAPSRKWTWAEMIQLIKDATVLDSPTGMAYYGLGYDNRLESYYGVAAGQQYIGEFGFNGKTFDLGVYAVGGQEFADLKLGGYVAPRPETQANEDWTGDWETWYGATGHVAVFSESFWTFQNLWNTEGFKQFNLNIVPYPVPAVRAEDAAAGTHNSIAIIDFGNITTSCQYPLEAYELMKFMGFGVDGWKTRLEAYMDDSITNASGMPLRLDVMPMPITKDAAIQEAYLGVYTIGMDEENVGHWREFFESCMRPIPYGWRSIPGYWNFCDQYFNKIGIHDLVDSGKAKAADYAVEGTEQANKFHAEAMIDYFGPGGYNVLSAEKIEEYEAMIAAAN